MINMQQPADKVAISFSLLRAIHCLITPLLLVLVPALAGLPIEAESIHKWMVVIVLPTSIIALTLGCKKHRKGHVVAMGAVGLLLLIGAIVLSMMGFGEAVEKTMTLAGAACIASAHLWNYRLCREHNERCDCH